MIATILLYGLVLYILIGLVTAVLFAIFGLARVLGPDTTVTVGARLLLLPGATALWPCVLIRWFKPGGAR